MFSLGLQQRSELLDAPTQGPKCLDRQMAECLWLLIVLKGIVAQEQVSTSCRLMTASKAAMRYSLHRLKIGES